MYFFKSMFTNEDSFIPQLICILFFPLISVLFLFWIHAKFAWYAMVLFQRVVYLTLNVYSIFFLWKKQYFLFLFFVASQTLNLSCTCNGLLRCDISSSDT